MRRNISLYSPKGSISCFETVGLYYSFFSEVSEVRVSAFPYEALNGVSNNNNWEVILMKVDLEAEARQIINEDPFHQHNIAEYEVIEFFPTKYDPHFSSFME